MTGVLVGQQFMLIYHLDHLLWIERLHIYIKLVGFKLAFYTLMSKSMLGSKSNFRLDLLAQNDLGFGGSTIHAHIPPALLIVDRLA